MSMLKSDYYHFRSVLVFFKKKKFNENTLYSICYLSDATFSQRTVEYRSSEEEMLLVQQVVLVTLLGKSIFSTVRQLIILFLKVSNRPIPLIQHCLLMTFIGR